MDIHIYEAGKPAKARAFDWRFTIAAGKISVGGAPPCEVVVPGVAEGAQAEIHVEAARAEIRNVGGSKVSVAGRAVPNGGSLALGTETLIAIGDKEMVFRGTPTPGAPGMSASGEKEAEERPSLLAKDMLKQVFSALGVPEEHPALVVYDPEDKVVKRVDLAPPEEEATIGRHPDNRVVLYHASVSKQHARVVRDGLGWLLSDLGSKNGTEVNGRPIKDKVRLNSGDKIKIGDFKVRFVDPKAAVQDLAGSVPDLKRIDAAKPGEKVVIGDKAKAFEDTKSGIEDTREITRKQAQGEQRRNTPAEPKPIAAAKPPESKPTAPAAPAPVAEPMPGDPLAEPAPGGLGSIVYVAIGVAVAILAGLGYLVMKAVG